MRPFPADADTKSQKSDASEPKGATPALGQANRRAGQSGSTILATGAPVADTRAEPTRGRLESKYQAHKRVSLGAVSSKPTAASGLPDNVEPSADGPEATEDAMRQAWNKVFGKKTR